MQANKVWMVLPVTRGFFYAYDGLLDLPQPDRFQVALEVMTGLFDRVGLRTKINNTVGMPCKPSRVAFGNLQEAYKRRMTVVGTSFQNIQWGRVRCQE